MEVVGKGMVVNGRARIQAPFIAWKYCQNRAADFHVILQTWAKTGDEDVSKHLQKTEPEKLDYDAIISSD